MYTRKKEFLVASKEIGQKVYAEKVSTKVVWKVKNVLPYNGIYC